MTISRRDLLRTGGCMIAGFGLRPMFPMRAARPPAAPPPQAVLVCLFLRGGADGLSIVVPHGDPLYYRRRPSIAVPRQDVLNLDGYFGLHPALAPLLPWWNSGHLAAVHAIGLPGGARGHCQAQDDLETGTPGQCSTRDGWLNRFLHHRRLRPGGLTPSIAFAPELPRILAGQAPALAVGSLDETVGSSLAQDPEYPLGRLGRILRELSRRMNSGPGLEVAFADVGGWDTHLHQGGRHGPLAARLSDLGRGLAALANDLGPRMRNVVLVTMSEFGRAVGENERGGTDHGGGTVALVLGGPVNGTKVFGRWPGLDREVQDQDRGLAVTTDFRDLFGEILVRHLGGADLSRVFPGFRPDARRFPGVIRTGP